MHERHMVESAIEAIKAAINKDGSKLVSASFAVGELSGISPESVRFYFESLTKGTALEGARLEFTQIPGGKGLELTGIETE